MPARARRPRALRSHIVATFTTRFLGCKVSFADEQAIRERLLGDGHTAGDGRRRRRRDQHVLCHQRGRREVAPGGSASRPHARARLRDGVRRQPLRERIRGHARQRPRPQPAQRGDRRCRRHRRGGDRLRAGRPSPRAGARLRQDPGRLLLLVRVLRHPARARRDPQPLCRSRARRDPAAGGAGPPRGRAHRRQPRLLPRSRRRDVLAGARSAPQARSTASSASASRRSRSTTSPPT